MAWMLLSTGKGYAAERNIRKKRVTARLIELPAAELPASGLKGPAETACCRNLSLFVCGTPAELGRRVARTFPASKRFHSGQQDRKMPEDFSRHFRYGILDYQEIHSFPSSGRNPSKRGNRPVFISSFRKNGINIFSGHSPFRTQLSPGCSVYTRDFSWTKHETCHPPYRTKTPC